MAERYNLVFIEAPHDQDSWDDAVRGHEADKENETRCKKCIAFRMDRTFAYAKANGFDWVATTLSVSRRKVTSHINEIGASLAEKHRLSFLGRDWKKANGENISQERAKTAGIYRQTYCGCRYSMRPPPLDTASSI